MDFITKNTDISRVKTPCIVVFAQDSALLSSAKSLDDSHCNLLSKLIKSKDLGTAAGNCTWITIPPANKTATYQSILLVQLGKTEKAKTTTISMANWVKVSMAIGAALTKKSAKDAAIFIDELELSNSNTKTLAQTLALSLTKSEYQYATTKKDVSAVKLKKVTVCSKQTSEIKNGMQLGKAVGEGVNTARELGNLPGNICTPTYLANLAKSFASDCANLSVKILSEKQMEKLGMGSLLSVAKGSEEEAKLIVMEYKNAASNQKPHVLVGKGITFDTGGISLKPGASMDEMKFDMCGAASVFGTMKALMSSQAKINVVGIVAAAENMPSGSASKPGDVVTSMSGQTIEILNTDAEGRLVLCDALTYAERFKPKSVVDIATLTGACVIALGSHPTGMYSNDDELAKSLIEAGNKTHDRVWQMPLWEDYQQQLNSNFADMANIGGREAGSVTAACFLARFTKSYKWAHLDIAGTAWLSGAKKGATGRPVALLFEYLTNN